MDAIVDAAASTARRATGIAREWLLADEGDGRVRNTLATVNGLVWVAVVLRAAGIG